MNTSLAPIRSQTASRNYGRVLATFMLIAMAALSGCQRAGFQAVPEPRLAPQVNVDRIYTLGAGDELEVRFFHNPELNQELPILPDGKVTLALVGQIQAAGLSVAEFTELLVEEYSAHLKLPEITAVVKAANSQLVYVGGEVSQPSVLPLVPGMSVRQALIQSGGPLVTARLSNVLVLRDQGTNEPQIFAVDLDYGVGREGIGPDLQLVPKDVVFVPKTFIAEVNVFVDQYLGRIVPRWLNFQLNYTVGGVKIN